MNSTVQAAIVVELATLEQLSDLPIEPFGYGSDLHCDDDMTVTADEIAGDTTEALGQAIYRRWITTKGRLPDDLDYGGGLWGALNRGTTQREILEWQGTLQTEAEKDDRVHACTVTLTLDSATGKTVSIHAQIIPNDPDLTDFAMTLAVLDDGALMLETITEA